MREIKFRGISKNNNRWVYGFVSIDKNSAKMEGFPHYISRSSGYLPVEVVPKSVGQSTGMKDKNGVEIYEGDIVQSTWYDVGNNPYKKIGEIIFVGAEYVIAYDSQFDVETGEITYDAHSLTYAEDVEVIGNIYENTELLEREAE